MPNIQPEQRIARLTPLDQALVALDAVMPVAAREIATSAALGRTLASDAGASACPRRALALRDGWAVRSELTSDASSYSPALLPEVPVRVDLGETLPPGMDAVAPLDALLVQEGQAEALTPLAVGDGVLPAGGDVVENQVLRRAGMRLCVTDVAVLVAAGIERVNARAPRIQIVRAAATGAVIDATVGLIARAVESEGGSSEVTAAAPETLKKVLSETEADTVIVIGGTGMGRHDASITTLRRIGQLAFHGVGLVPGETLAFGWIGARPVLLLPGRLDAALAGWLLFGQPLLAKLCGRADQNVRSSMLELSRKVTSTVGMTEIVPVRRHGDRLEPLASGYLPLSSLVSDGWILISPESEGHPAGTRVAMRPWP